MNNKEYNLSVTLTPLEHYFFGEENRHPDGTEKYLQKSSKLPQQTSLLGSMRFLLLQISDSDIFINNRIQDKEKAKLLIGESSFNIVNKNDYGEIKALSEVMIWNEKNGFYLPLIGWENNSIFYEKTQNKTIDSCIELNNGSCFFDNSNCRSSVFLPNYKVKEGTSQFWLNESGEKITNSSIFTEYQHAGNFKNKENKEENDEDAYFKMCYYRMHPDFSFVFNMQINNNAIIENLTCQQHLIFVGGERSKFSCKIEKIEKNNPKMISNELYQKIYGRYKDKNYIKVILTSDAYLENNPSNLSVFSITEIKKMRFISTKVENTEEYYNRQKTKVEITEKIDNSQKLKIEIRKGFETSELYNLLKRGSTFYFKTKEDENNIDIENIFINKIFQKIGYNQYCILK